MNDQKYARKYAKRKINLLGGSVQFYKDKAETLQRQLDLRNYSNEVINWEEIAVQLYNIIMEIQDNPVETEELCKRAKDIGKECVEKIVPRNEVIS